MAISNPLALSFVAPELLESRASPSVFHLETHTRSSFHSSSCFLYGLAELVESPGFDLSVRGIFHHFTIKLVGLVFRFDMGLAVRVILHGNALELALSELRPLDRFSVWPKPVRVAMQFARAVLRLHDWFSTFIERR